MLRLCGQTYVIYIQEKSDDGNNDVFTGASGTSNG